MRGHRRRTMEFGCSVFEMTRCVMAERVAADGRGAGRDDDNDAVPKGKADGEDGGGRSQRV